MSVEDNQHKRRNNYKLLVDPELQKGKKKLYRLNGAIPGKPPIPDPKDPRVLKTVLGLVGSDLELPIPRFKYDRFWVGDAPQREVLVTGLPESLQHGSLLKESCETIGPVHTIRYHKHPKSRAFLGAASILYCKAGDGLIAADKLNESIVGGVILQVVLDDKEEHLKKYLEPVTKDPRRESVDSAKAQEITTPTIKQDGGTLNFNSHDSETKEEEKMSSLNQKFYPFSSLTLKNNSTSSVGESPLSSCFSPGLSTPSSIDSGISLKPNFDPLLALRSSLGQSLASKRQNAPPPLPPSVPPPPPPEEQIPPPPPTKEEAIENISSDEEQKSYPNSNSSTISKKLISKDVPLSPAVTLISPPFNAVSNANFELEYEEISGDESPVMVYNTVLEVEEISSDEGHGSDMEISDEDTNPDNLIEFNVAASNKTFYPTPPIPPPPLPPIPPSFPPPLPPPPNFFPEPSYQLSEGYSDHKSSAVKPTPSLPTAYYNGYPQDSSYYSSSGVNKAKFSPAKQWKVPAAFTQEERRSQNVLFYALEQLLRILVRDVEKKLVESAAFPVLDEFWEKKDKEKQKTKSSNEVEPEGEDSKKPLEPYRRMLPGLLPQTSDHQHREGDADVDAPITPRKRLMNFKIPLTNRGTHRRNAVMIARRRLHDTDKDNDRKRRQRKRRAGHTQSPRPRKRRHHVTHLSVLSDISSDELSSDEKRETDDDDDDDDQTRKEIVSGPHTPSETSEDESEQSQLNEIFGSSSSSSNFEDEIVRIRTSRTRKPSTTKPRTTQVSKEATHLVLEEPEPAVKEEDIVKVVEYRKRIPKQEEDIVSAFLKFGPDKEDVIMMKLALTRLKIEGVEFVQDVPWSHYPSAILAPPPQKRRKFQEEDFHPSGCARSEGYYKIDASDKSKYLHHLRRNKSNNLTSVAQTQVNPGSSGRGNRLNHRRVASLFTSGDVSRELQQYNQLKARKKQLRFAKSTIHNWGLFALEAIPADEMVVEYIGQVVRHVVADERERRYEAQGIGSSYLFRVDYDYVIDATKSGNHARFINHCCDPNCYAKIISVGTQKKIVIYSKRDIQSGEEITYDYKFPIEDEKIPCLCGAPQCRGTLN